MVSAVDPRCEGSSHGAALLSNIAYCSQSLPGPEGSPHMPDSTVHEESTNQGGNLRSLFLWSFQSCLEEAMAEVLERRLSHENAYRPLFDHCVGNCLSFISATVASEIRQPADEVQKLFPTNGSCVSGLLPESRSEPPTCVRLAVSEPYEKVPGSYSVVPQQWDAVCECPVAAGEVEPQTSSSCGESAEGSLEPVVAVRNIEASEESGGTRNFKVLWAEPLAKDVVRDIQPAARARTLGSNSGNDSTGEAERLQEELSCPGSLAGLEHLSPDERGFPGTDEGMASDSVAEENEVNILGEQPPVATLTRAELVEIVTSTLRYNRALRRELSEFWLCAPKLSQLVHYTAEKGGRQCNSKADCGQLPWDEVGTESGREKSIRSGFSDEGGGNGEGALEICEQQRMRSNSGVVEVETPETNSVIHPSLISGDLWMLFADRAEDVGGTLGLGPSFQKHITSSTGDGLTPQCAAFTAGVRSSDCHCLPTNADDLGQQQNNSAVHDGSAQEQSSAVIMTGNQHKGSMLNEIHASGRFTQEAGYSPSREIPSLAQPGLDTEPSTAEHTGLLQIASAQESRAMSKGTNKLGLSGISEFCSVQEAVRKESQGLRDLVHFYSVFISECVQGKANSSSAFARTPSGGQ